MPTEKPDHVTTFARSTPIVLAPGSLSVIGCASPGPVMTPCDGPFAIAGSDVQRVATMQIAETDIAWISPRFTPGLHPRPRFGSGGPAPAPKASGAAKGRAP